MLNSYTNYIYSLDKLSKRILNPADGSVINCVYFLWYSKVDLFTDDSCEEPDVPLCVVAHDVELEARYQVQHLTLVFFQQYNR